MMIKKKAVMIWAAFILFFTAVPTTGLVAGQIFPVSPFRITMVSTRGPVSAWRCGGWTGVNWTPDYFGAEWAPWMWPGCGPEWYMSYALGGGWYNWYGWVNGGGLWILWAHDNLDYLYRPRVGGNRVGKHHHRRPPAPAPVDIDGGRGRRRGAAPGHRRHDRRPPAYGAPSQRTPRSLPRMRRGGMRSEPMRMPSRGPTAYAGSSGRHRR